MAVYRRSYNYDMGSRRALSKNTTPDLILEDEYAGKEMEILGKAFWDEATD